jgi:hypothetical protein
LYNKRKIVATETEGERGGSDEVISKTLAVPSSPFKRSPLA